MTPGNTSKALDRSGKGSQQRMHCQAGCCWDILEGRIECAIEWTTPGRWELTGLVLFFWLVLSWFELCAQKEICWCPNPQDLKMGCYLARRFLWLRWGHFQVKQAFDTQWPVSFLSIVPCEEMESWKEKVACKRRQNSCDTVNSQETSGAIRAKGKKELSLET